MFIEFFSTVSSQEMSLDAGRVTSPDVSAASSLRRAKSLDRRAADASATVRSFYICKKFLYTVFIYIKTGFMLYHIDNSFTSIRRAPVLYPRSLAVLTGRCCCCSSTRRHQVVHCTALQAGRVAASCSPGAAHCGVTTTLWCGNSTVVWQVGFFLVFF